MTCFTKDPVQHTPTTTRPKSVQFSHIIKMAQSINFNIPSLGTTAAKLTAFFRTVLCLKPVDPFLRQILSVLKKCGSLKVGLAILSNMGEMSTSYKIRMDTLSPILPPIRNQAH